ncbi:MAG TPA: hypothetical protein VF084_03430 [Nitrososphaeraceae archaeon]
MTILLTSLPANGVDQKENVEGIDFIENRFNEISLSLLDPIYCEVIENHLSCKNKDGFDYKIDILEFGNVSDIQSPSKINVTEEMDYDNRLELNNTIVESYKANNVLTKELVPIPRNNTCIKNEPTVASNSSFIFYTGNHFASRSLDGGQQWNFIDPNVGFPFCCDQRVIYDPNHKLYVWYIQGEDEDKRDDDKSNYVRLAISTNLSNWTLYDFKAKNIDDRKFQNIRMDYPHLVTDDNYLYFTTNIFNMNPENETKLSKGSLILRFDLAELSHFNGSKPVYFHDEEARTITPVKGAKSEMYFATFPEINSTTGIPDDKKVIRIYQTNQSSIVKVQDIEVHGFKKLNRHGSDCNNATKKDWWCGAIDSRIMTGWLDNDRIGLLWHANKVVDKNNTKINVPYIDGVILDLKDKMKEIERPYISNSNYALAFPDVAFNGNGELGIVAFYGNKSTPVNLAFGVYSDPSASWKIMSLLNSTYILNEPAFDPRFNKCFMDSQRGDPTLNQWGDYITINKYYGNNSMWEIAGYTIYGPDFRDAKPYYLLVKN